jgi:hypothetical protein
MPALAGDVFMGFNKRYMRADVAWQYRTGTDKTLSEVANSAV